MDSILIFLDYFSTIDKKLIIYEWIIPLAIALGAYCLLSHQDTYYDIYEFIVDSMQVIATLLGFTLAALTLFLTNNSQICEMKKFKTKKIIDGKEISLYRLLTMNYSYLIVVETIMCASFYIGKLFSPICSQSFANFLNTIFIWLFFHILLLTIRTVVDLYFVVSKE
jgi:hypothetical protein